MFVISLAGVLRKSKSATTRVMHVGVPDGCGKIDVPAARECSSKLKSTSTRVMRVEALDQRLR